MKAKNVVVIVDGVRSGYLLPTAFRSAGISSIHISSIQMLGYMKDHYVFGSLATSEIDEIIDMLLSPKWKVLAVVPGTESGVYLADRLAARLGIRERNDERTSHLRRNKLMMTSAARNANVPTIPSRAIKKPSEVRESIEKEQWLPPYIIKPVLSGGTDDVIFCPDFATAEAAAGRLIGKENVLHEINNELIFQPFVSGVEYVVDTISYRGKHKVVDIWSTVKGTHNGHHFVPEYTEAVLEYTKLPKNLISVTFDLLDSIGLRFGAGHTELIVDKNDKVIVVETAARVHGASFPRFADEVWGHSQVSELVSTYVKGKLPRHRNRKYDKNLRIVELISYTTGKLKAIPQIKTIRNLKTYFADTLPESGEHLSKTINALTSPGVVVLTGESLEEIEADYNFIHHIQRENKLFELF